MTEQPRFLPIATPDSSTPAENVGLQKFGVRPRDDYPKLPSGSSSYLIAPLIDKYSPIKLDEEMTARFAWMHQPLLN